MKTYTDLLLISRPTGFLEYTKHQDKIHIIDFEAGLIAVSLWSDIKPGLEIRYPTLKGKLRYKVLSMKNASHTTLYDKEGRRIYVKILKQEYVGKLIEA